MAARKPYRHHSAAHYAGSEGSMRPYSRNNHTTTRCAYRKDGYRSCGVKGKAFDTSEFQIHQETLCVRLRWSFRWEHNITGTYIAMQNTLIAKELMHWTQ